MTSRNKFISLLILISFVNIWYFFFYVRLHPTSLEVIPVDTSITLFTEPDSGRNLLLDAINSAKKEVLVEVYLLSDKEIISSLENARTRGIAVNVMMEAHPFGGGNINPKTKDELTTKNIKVQWSNPEFALTHEKAIVIDGSIAFILSQNLTTSAFTKNREFNVIDKNPTDVTEIRTIFIADWQRTSFSPSNNSHLIESPDNSRPALNSLINSAQKEIDIEVEDINDKEIISLFSNKAKTIPVKIILPTLSQLSGNKSAIKELSSNGVQVKTLSNPYIHGKMILIDKQKAYVGSINFSSQSLDSNRELGIIISQVEALNIIGDTFSNDWNKAQPVSLVK